MLLSNEPEKWQILSTVLGPVRRTLFQSTFDLPAFLKDDHRRKKSCIQDSSAAIARSWFAYPHSLAYFIEGSIHEFCE